MEELSTMVKELQELNFTKEEVDYMRDRIDDSLDSAREKLDAIDAQIQMGTSLKLLGHIVGEKLDNTAMAGNPRAIEIRDKLGDVDEKIEKLKALHEDVLEQYQTAQRMLNNIITKIAAIQIILSKQQIK